MPRTARIAPGGVIFHCLNRGNARQALFDDEADYAAFEGVLEATLEAVPVDLLAYCLMYNHWHLLVRPQKAGQLGAFMQRLTTTHVRRWHRQHDSDGQGHLYQGTYKSFPVQDDRHFSTVARYIERNPLRAGKVKHAQDWRWSSLWVREKGSVEQRARLSEWPVTRRRDWLDWVNIPQTDKELAALREAIKRGRPFGDSRWQAATAKRLGLEAAFRKRGRPKKKVDAGRK